MPRGLVILAMVAMLLAAAGLMLWQWAAARQARKLATKHLEQQMKERVVQEQAAFDIRRARSASTSLSGDPWAAAEQVAAAAAQRRSGLLGKIPLPTWLTSVASARVLALGVTAIVGISAAAYAMAGALVAFSVLVLLTLLATFGIWLRIQKMRKKLVHQLPGFIDSMVRLITIGNSIHAAFTLAASTAKAPLREYLEGASGLVRAGVDLDQALSQMARNVDIEEMHLLASILGLGVRYGGRADVLLERVAGFMRDREQAEQELVALSAETRLSAWILGLLPISIGAVMVALNPGHFSRMLSDSTGLIMMWGALGLQAFGAILLYRLARLA